MVANQGGQNLPEDRPPARGILGEEPACQHEGVLAGVYASSLLRWAPVRRPEKGSGYWRRTLRGTKFQVVTTARQGLMGTLERLPFLGGVGGGLGLFAPQS